MVALFRIPHREAGGKQPAGYYIMVIVGYLLSPLSWWNDAVVNVPLAYVFSIPFTLLSERLFIPAFTIGYLATNLAGFVLLHKGVSRLVHRRPVAWNFRGNFIVTLIYTGVIALLAWVGWIPAADELLNKLN